MAFHARNAFIKSNTVRCILQLSTLLMAINQLVMADLNTEMTSPTPFSEVDDIKSSASEGPSVVVVGECFVVVIIVSCFFFK